MSYGMFCSKVVMGLFSIALSANETCSRHACIESS